MDKLEHVFIFPEFNESECWSQRGEEAGAVRKPDESQKRGGTAGIVLAEITPSLIATAARSCQDHRRSVELLSLPPATNRRCHLPAPICPARCQPPAFCLLD